jgi:hypothetical protein
VGEGHLAGGDDAYKKYFAEQTKQTPNVQPSKKSKSLLSILKIFKK